MLLPASENSCFQGSENSLHFAHYLLTCKRTISRNSGSGDCGWLMPDQQSRKAGRPTNLSHFKHLPGCRLARWAVKGAVRLRRCV